MTEMPIIIVLCIVVYLIIGLHVLADEWELHGRPKLTFPVLIIHMLTVILWPIALVMDAIVERMDDDR